MSKLYAKYLEKKKENKDKYYLFKSGMFYIFLSEDAINISKITTLNISNLNSEIVKCGFPKKSLDKYLDIFKNMNLDIEIIEDIDFIENSKEDKVVKTIKKIDIDSITPIEALNILKKIKDSINE